MTNSVFVDSAVFIEVAWNDGPARTLLRLGEAGAIKLLVSSRVLREVETAIRRMAPADLGPLAVLLDQCGVTVVPRAGTAVVKAATKLIRDRHTAYVVADAGAARADFFVTFDNEQIVNNARLLETAPFAAGSPENCIAWLKEKLR
jgi:predicted nucleic acid-binding protein